MAVVILWLLVAGLVELSVIVAVAHAIGWLSVGLLLVLASAVGAWITKRQGTAAWRRIVESVRVGEMPTDALIDACIVVAAGALLLVPGFLSDVVGLSLAIPAVRMAVRRRAVGSLRRRVDARVADAGRGGTAGFGFGVPGGRAYQRPFDGFGQWPTDDARHDGRDDIIDLDSEEVFIDEPSAELEPPRDASA